MLILDLEGTLRHECAAYERLLEDEPERGKVELEVRRVARAVASLARCPTKARAEESGQPALRDVRTARARYRIRGSLLPAGLVGPAPAVLVTLELLTPVPPSASALRARFGLSAREAEVARLIAEACATPRSPAASG